MKEIDKLERHIEALKAYPKIHDIVMKDFGTVRLKEFLDTLLADAYDQHGKNRNGFPFEVSSALISISLINQRVLEDMGMNFDDDPVSAFAVSQWKLPRNF